MRTKVEHNGKTIAFTEGRVLKLHCDENKMLSDVTITVDAEEGITPSGTLDITENGTYDVTENASVNVNVPETPTFDGSITIVDGILVTFTIDGKRYMAMMAMYWRDWVASEYNTDGYYISDEGGICIGSKQVEDSDRVNQAANGIVIEGEAYTTY